MWSKEACDRYVPCDDQTARIVTSFAFLVAAAAARRARWHLALLTAASVWYWASESFLSRVSDGVLVATLPFAILYELDPAALLFYVLALEFYLVLGECTTVGWVIDLPSYIAYAAIVALVTKTDRVNWRTAAGGAVAALGGVFLLGNASEGNAAVGFCWPGMGATSVGHVLVGIGLAVFFVGARS
jgi:hypothetical protein